MNTDCMKRTLKCLSNKKTTTPSILSISTGSIFKHYKGSKYQILNLATHTETEEKLVIYTNVSEPDNKIWARPLDMFLGTVEVNRFEPITK